MMICRRCLLPLLPGKGYSLPLVEECLGVGGVPPYQWSIRESSFVGKEGPRSRSGMRVEEDVDEGRGGRGGISSAVCFKSAVVRWRNEELEGVLLSPP